jgi:predicted ester cyclase
VRSAEDHRRTVHRLFDEVWNGRDVSVIPALYCVDFVADYRPYAPLRQGHHGVRAMVEGAIAAFPDYHEELLGMCVDGAHAAVHLRVTGTQLGPWGPLAPTGKHLVFEEMMWLTFDEHGLVRHQRGIVDNLLALRQAGVTPTPSGPDST